MVVILTDKRSLQVKTIKTIFSQTLMLLIHYFRYNIVDVNVAVATPAGLITPIVSRADSKVKLQNSYPFSLICQNRRVFKQAELRIWFFVR